MKKALFITLTAFLLAGCVSTKYVPVETVRTEYTHNTDTVIQTDTVKSEKETIIREVNAGDSTMLAEMGIKLKDNERLLIMMQKQLNEAKSHHYESKTDTIIINDTIRVPYPVEKELTFFQKAAVNGFAYITIALIVLFIILMFRWKR